LSAQQIAKRLKQSTETVRRLLDTMKKAGQLRAKLQDGRNLYRLPR
jgi:DNA-binding IclR family transcriptional regulator